VTAIAFIFFLASGYLLVIGLILLFKPGTVSLMSGSSLLGGLELAGPYMFLLMTAVGATIGLGLLRLHNWARRVTTIAAVLGIVWLVPTVSAAATGSPSIALLWSGLGIMVRAAIVWYLYQAPIAEAFTRRRNT
jgi:hypothetical protein